MVVGELQRFLRDRLSAKELASSSFFCSVLWVLWLCCCSSPSSSSCSVCCYWLLFFFIFFFLRRLLSSSSSSSSSSFNSCLLLFFFFFHLVCFCFLFSVCLILSPTSRLNALVVKVRCPRHGHKPRGLLPGRALPVAYSYCMCYRCGEVKEG